MIIRFWPLVLVLAAFGTPRPAAAGDADCFDDALAKSYFNEVLAEGGWPTTGPALIARLRRQAPAVTFREATDLLAKLGSDDFNEREKATRRVASSGPAMLPLLRQARQSADAEVARRAIECMQEIEKNHNPALTFAIVHTIAALKPDGADEALLAYLPAATTDDVREAIWYALDAAVAREGTVPKAAEHVLGDSWPAQRAAAAYLLARYGSPSQRAAAKDALGDAEVEVRVRAAQGLLAAKDKAGLPALIAALAQAPLPLAWQAEELLRYAAGEGQAPPVVIGDGSEVRRSNCRKGWEDWWQKQGRALDISRLDQGSRRPTLLVMWSAPLPPKDRVWLCGCDGVPRWELTLTDHVADASLLPEGRLLLAQWSRASEDMPGKVHPDGAFSGVSLREPSGKVVWRYLGLFRPASCELLPGGAVRVTDDKSADVHLLNVRGERLESARAGTSRDRYPTLPSLWLPYGNNLLIKNWHQPFPDLSRLVEFDPSGKAVWEVEKDRCAGARVCLRMVRLGFSQPRPADFDLGSVTTRVAGLASKDASIRRMSAWALWSRGSGATEAVPALVGALGDSDTSVGKAVEEALRKIGAPTLTGLVQATRAKSARARARAVTLLGELLNGDKPVEDTAHGRERVIAALTDEDPLVRVQAAYALGRFRRHAEDVVGPLAAALKDPAVPPEERRYHVSVGQAAAAGLGMLGTRGRAAIPELIEAANSPDDLLSASALSALTQVGKDDERVISTLLAMLRDPKRQSKRVGAVWALGELRANDAVPQILALVPAKEDKTPEATNLRKAIATALGNLGPSAVKAAAPVLIALVADEQADSQVRQLAAVALSRMESPSEEALSALRGLLKSEDSGLREVARNLLAKVSRSK